MGTTFYTISWFDFVGKKCFRNFQAFVQVLEDYDGKPSDPHYITMMAISNIIYSIVNGNRNDYDDEIFNRYVRDLYESFEALGDSGIVMVFPFLKYVSRNLQYKHVYRRRIEIPQRTHIFPTKCCLEVHNAPLKLVSPLSG